SQKQEHRSKVKSLHRHEPPRLRWWCLSSQMCSSDPALRALHSLSSATLSYANSQKVPRNQFNEPTASDYFTSAKSQASRCVAANFRRRRSRGNAPILRGRLTRNMFSGSFTSVTNPQILDKRTNSQDKSIS